MKKYLFFLLAFPLLFVACASNSSNPTIKVEDRPVSHFDRILLNGPGELMITQSDNESLKIEGEEKTLSQVITEVKNGVLSIEVKESNSWFGGGATLPLKFHLSAKQIHGLETKGSGEIKSANLLTDKLAISQDGASNITVANLSTQELQVKVAGTGQILLAGQAATQQITLSGTGFYNAPELTSQNATVNISGTGKAQIWAQSTLTAEISGTGNIEYYGSPKVTQKITGAGRVNHLGNR